MFAVIATVPAKFLLKKFCSTVVEFILSLIKDLSAVLVDPIPALNVVVLSLVPISDLKAVLVEPIVVLITVLIAVLVDPTAILVYVLSPLFELRAVAFFTNVASR